MMMKTKREQLNDCFVGAIKSNSRYVAVFINVGLEQNETIINSRENFAEKLAYYNSVYDDNLNHKHAEGINIVAFTYGDSFSEIEANLGLYVSSTNLLV
jgi:hypothetical protein